MKFNLEINNLVNSRIPKSYFERVISETIKKSKTAISGKFNISLAVVSDKEIRKVNRIYRNRDEVTDILSFSDYSKKKGRKKIGMDVFFELIVCYPYIVKSAKIHRVTEKQEMAYVVSHGMLHCLGFNHGKRMFAVQDKVSEIF